MNPLYTIYIEFPAAPYDNEIVSNFTSYRKAREYCEKTVAREINYGVLVGRTCSLTIKSNMSDNALSVYNLN